MATSNVPPVAGSPVFQLPIFFAGQRGTDATDAAKWKAPFPFDVLSIQGSARASGGTSPTLAVDVLADGTSILTAPMAVATGTTINEAGLATTRITDEQLVSLNLDFGGTSPTFDDVLIVITGVRI